VFFFLQMNDSCSGNIYLKVRLFSIDLPLLIFNDQSPGVFLYSPCIYFLSSKLAVSQLI
jgi:hypothetical protein